MNGETVIFGASTLGHSAWVLYRDKRQIVAFSDNDPEKWGNSFCGLPVIPPNELPNRQASVIIASSWHTEITEQLWNIGIRDALVFPPAVRGILPSPSNRFPDLDLNGILDLAGTTMEIDCLTFFLGGSWILDYFYIQSMFRIFNCKQYFEIGSFTGESLSAIAPWADHCYALTLPTDHLTSYFSSLGKHNYSLAAASQFDNITYYLEDSKTFDFTRLPDNMDMVYIDGDHRYSGVVSDTRNCFSRFDPNHVIIIWHDLRSGNRVDYNPHVYQGIVDAVPTEKLKNVFGVYPGMCAVYLPDQYIKKLPMANANKEIKGYRTVITSREIVPVIRCNSQPT